MKNKIICSYSPEARFGFGDFLRGSLHVKKIFDERGFEFDIDFSKHEIGKYISSNYSGDDYDESDINKNIEKGSLLKELTGEHYICRNSFTWSHGRSIAGILRAFAESIPKSDLEYFKKKIIFSDDVVKELDSRLKAKNINSYKVIQVRTGDADAFSEDGEMAKDSPGETKTDFKYEPEKYFKYITIFLERLPQNENFIFISDNSELKGRIKKHFEQKPINNIFVLTGDASHTSRAMLRKLYDKPIVLDLFETAIDLYLLSKSEENTSISCYSFASNFCQWISLIFNIKYTILNVHGRDLFQCLQSGSSKPNEIIK
jgi:hypothetical protein